MFKTRAEINPINIKNNPRYLVERYITKGGDFEDPIRMSRSSSRQVLSFGGMYLGFRLNLKKKNKLS